MKKVISLFYGFQFFFSLLLWLPVFYEYQKTIGLSDTQIFNIQSIYYIAFCFLEIPTGMLADRFGYKRCLFFGGVALVVSNLLPIFAQNYPGFLSHFLLIALARSLVSGAGSAYIFDYLKAHSAEDLYKQTEGRARAYSLVGKVVCWAGVGPLMAWHLTMPYWLTTLAAAVSVVLAWWMPPLPAESPAGGAEDAGTLIVHTSLVDRWSEALRRLREIAGVLRRTPALVFFMVQGIAIFVLSRVCQVNLFQPILSSKQFTLATFGLVMSYMTIFEAIGSFGAGWLKRFMSDVNAVYVLTLAMAVSLMLIPSAGMTLTLFWLGLFSLATGIAFPVQRQLINETITDSGYRATILSIESIADRAANAWIASLIGGYLAAGRLNDFLVFSGGLGVALVLALVGVAGLAHVLGRRSRSLAEPVSSPLAEERVRVRN